MMVTDCVVPRAWVLGTTELIAGPWLMVNPLANVAVPASRLVTVTSWGPTGAPDPIVTLTVIFDTLLRVVELIVIPDPENDTTTPVAKFVPLMTTLWFVAP